MSLIYLFIYLLILTLIKIFFPHKKIPYWIVLLGFSILPTLSILREGSYQSGDINIHVVRTMDFYKSLSEGIIIPRWAGDLNSTYGYALFGYFYNFPYYISSLYHFLGLGFLASVKFFLITTYIASGLAMYIWLRRHFSEKASFLGSLLYLFAPYHLVDMHFRNAVGEMGAFVMVPLSFYCIDKVIENKQFLWIFLTGISTFFLLLSHPAIFVMESILIVAYPIIRLRKKSLINIINVISGIILGILYASFNWLPIFLESKFVYQRQNEIVLSFPKLSEIIYSPWRFGFLFQGPKGELSPIIGYAHLIVLFICLLLIIFKNYRNNLLLFFTIFTFLYILLTQKISAPIWNNIYFLRNMFIPSRFLLIISFTISFLSAFLVNKIKNNILFYFLIIATIGTSILNWGNRANTPQIKDDYLRENLPLINEGAWNAVPITRPFDIIWPFKIPNEHIEAIDGKIDIIYELRKTTNHIYSIKMYKSGLVKENTYYFPGWKLYVNGKENIIIYDNDRFPGIITFYLNAGENNINLIFTDTIPIKISFYLSSVPLLISGFYLIISVNKRKIFK